MTVNQALIWFYFLPGAILALLKVAVLAGSDRLREHPAEAVFWAICDAGIPVFNLFYLIYIVIVVIRNLLNPNQP